jgi:adenylate kinase
VFFPVLARLILIAGTPGTGKTVVGSRLARIMDCRFTTLSWFVLEHGLWTGYDWERRSFIIDYDQLTDRLSSLAGSEGCFIFETHWLEPFEAVRDSVDAVILLRCHPLVLYERLVRRGWPIRKVAENVEAELVGVVAHEAASIFSEKAFELVTSGTSVEATVSSALKALRQRLTRCCLSWIDRLKEDEIARVMSLVGATS